MEHTNPAYIAKEDSRRRSGSGTTAKALLSKNGHAPKSRPSKNGAGKGNWGSVSSEIADRVRTHSDSKDYDEEQNEQNEYLSELKVQSSDDEVRDILIPLLPEYRVTSDASDFMNMCSRLHPNPCSAGLTELIIEFGLECNPEGRELCSQLLSNVSVSNYAKYDGVEAGFEALMRRIDDIIIDVPDAVDALAKFMARAIADECAPPSYIFSHPKLIAATRSRTASEVLVSRAESQEPDKQKRGQDNGDEEEEEEEDDVGTAHFVVQRVSKLLTAQHAMPHLDTIWGVSGIQLTINTLRERIELLVEEYLSANDLAEAERCVKDLRVPHFHHELVHRCCYVAMLRGQEKRIPTVLCKLLDYLFSTGDLTRDQIYTGLRRTYEEFEDTEIDIPFSHIFLSHVVTYLFEAGIIFQDIKDEMPARKSRSRYTSENDSAGSSSLGASAAAASS